MAEIEALSIGILKVSGAGEIIRQQLIKAIGLIGLIGTLSFYQEKTHADRLPASS